MPRPVDSYDLPTQESTQESASALRRAQEFIRVPSPRLSLNPGRLSPGTQLPESTPEPEQSVLSITQPEVPGPLFTGDTYTIRWTYTSERIATFAVSISRDGDESFTELAHELTGDSYELTLPDEPSENCLLRVTAYVYEIDYAHADTLPFVLLSTSEPLPTPDANYVNPNVQYTRASNINISNLLDEPIWFKAESEADDADRLIWQLSKIPFWGTRESFGDEKGLISTGVIDMALAASFPSTSRRSSRSRATYGRPSRPS